MIRIVNEELGSAVNNSSTILYDVRKYQEELDIPIRALLQEVCTRWWAILLMLESLVISHTPIILALSKANKNYLILDREETNREKEIIKLLTSFKIVGELLGKEKAVTISAVVPMLDYMKNTVLKINNGIDSHILQDMKKVMTLKLASSYSVDQGQFLTCVAFLDPRYKGSVNFIQSNLKSTVKTIVEDTGTIHIIPTTQGQALDNIHM